MDGESTYPTQSNEAIRVTLLYFLVVCSRVASVSVHYKGYMIWNRTCRENGQEKLLSFLDDFGLEPPQGHGRD